MTRAHILSLQTNRGEIKAMGDMEPVGETGLSQVRKSVTNLFVQRQSWMIWLQNKNKTQYFRLRLYLLLFWCSECSLNALGVLSKYSLSALWVLSECSLSAYWLMTYTWLIAWSFEPEWWRLTALDKPTPDGQTDRQTKWLLELLSEPKYKDPHLVSGGSTLKTRSWCLSTAKKWGDSCRTTSCEGKHYDKP